MVESPGMQDAAFYQSLFLLHGHSESTYVSRENYSVTHGKYKILTDVRIEYFHVHVLYSLFSHAYRVVQFHGVGSSLYKAS